MQETEIVIENLELEAKQKLIRAGLTPKEIITWLNTPVVMFQSRTPREILKSEDAKELLDILDGLYDIEYSLKKKDESDP